jgi:hypothetical protein
MTYSGLKNLAIVNGSRTSAMLCLTFTYSGTAADRLFGKVDDTISETAIMASGGS